MFSVIPTRWCWAFALSVLALDATRDALLAGAPASGVTLNDVPLGPVIGTGGGHYDPRPISTRYGTRTLVAAAKGSRVQAYVDGQPGPVVNAIPVTQSRPLPEGGAQGSPLFSPDEKRVADIVSLDNGKSAVVVDGTQSPIYDNVG